MGIGTSAMEWIKRQSSNIFHLFPSTSKPEAVEERQVNFAAQYVHLPNEILEMIFSQVVANNPPSWDRRRSKRTSLNLFRELARCKLVERRWKDVIEGSNPLRKALFMKPKPPDHQNTNRAIPRQPPPPRDMIESHNLNIHFNIEGIVRTNRALPSIRYDLWITEGDALPTRRNMSERPNFHPMINRLQHCASCIHQCMRRQGRKPMPCQPQSVRFWDMDELQGQVQIPFRQPNDIPLASIYVSNPPCKGLVLKIGYMDIRHGLMMPRTSRLQQETFRLRDASGLKLDLLFAVIRKGMQGKLLDVLRHDKYVVNIHGPSQRSRTFAYE